MVLQQTKRKVSGPGHAFDLVINALLDDLREISVEPFL